MFIYRGRSGGNFSKKYFSVGNFVEKFSKLVEKKYTDRLGVVLNFHFFYFPFLTQFSGERKMVYSLFSVSSKKIEVELLSLFFIALFFKTSSVFEKPSIWINIPPLPHPLFEKVPRKLLPFKTEITPFYEQFTQNSPYPLEGKWNRLFSSFFKKCGKYLSREVTIFPKVDI